MSELRECAICHKPLSKGQIVCCSNECKFMHARKYQTQDEALYNVWKTMMHRCHNPKREKYSGYGGRGIYVCDEWKDFDAFALWANDNGYAPRLEIDRVDNDGPYMPSNCRFVTGKVNSRNRRNTKLLTIRGVTKCVAEWCETVHTSQFTIYYWIRERGREYAEQRLAERMEKDGQAA